MWFKVFVLLRTPVSGVMLFGYGIGPRIWREALGPLAGMILLGLLVFLAFVSIRLVQFRKGALGLAGALLLLELVGSVLMMAVGDYLALRMLDPLRAAGVAGAVGLVWTLPNVVILYTQRGKFVEVDTKKPRL